MQRPSTFSRAFAEAPPFSLSLSLHSLLFFLSFLFLSPFTFPPSEPLFFASACAALSVSVSLSLSLYLSLSSYFSHVSYTLPHVNTTEERKEGLPSLFLSTVQRAHLWISPPSLPLSLIHAKVCHWNTM